MFPQTHVVTEKLAELLPGALLMLDDWELRHKTAGLTVLQMLLQTLVRPTRILV